MPNNAKQTVVGSKPNRLGAVKLGRCVTWASPGGYIGILASRAPTVRCDTEHWTDLDVGQPTDEIRSSTSGLVGSASELRWVVVEALADDAIATPDLVRELLDSHHGVIGAGELEDPVDHRLVTLDEYR